jgi:hypothetical protein
MSITIKCLYLCRGLTVTMAEKKKNYVPWNKGKTDILISG